MKNVNGDKCLVNLMNSFQRWELLYALGGESAEYVFGFVKQNDINLKYVLSGSCYTSSFQHTSHVSGSLFTPRLSDNIFHKPYIRCSFFTCAGYNTSFSSKYQKGKMVCMPVIVVRLAYLLSSEHTVFCYLPNVLAALSHSHSSVFTMMQLKIL
jgi:hypothetical protein